jgi:hypothetical protein
MNTRLLGLHRTATMSSSTTRAIGMFSQSIRQRAVNNVVSNKWIGVRGLSSNRKIPPPIIIPPPPPQASFRKYVPLVSVSVFVVGFLVLYSLPADVDDDYITFQVGPGMQKGPKTPPTKEEVVKAVKQQ